MATLTHDQADMLHGLFVQACEAARTDGLCVYGVGQVHRDKKREEYHLAWQAFSDALDGLAA